MEHPLDSTSPDGMFRHVVPMHGLIRIILATSGIFVMAVASYELWRGVWPPNITSPFFALLIAGAFAVGGPIALAGIAAPATTWNVRPGRIDIVLRNPFRATLRSFTPDTVIGFDLREHEWDSRPKSWSVTMRTTSGETFETRDFGSRSAAEQLRLRIENLFHGR